MLKKTDTDTVTQESLNNDISSNLDSLCNEVVCLLGLCVFWLVIGHYFTHSY